MRGRFEQAHTDIYVKMELLSFCYITIKSRIFDNRKIEFLFGFCSTSDRFRIYALFRRFSYFFFGTRPLNDLNARIWQKTSNKKILEQLF